MPKSSQAARNSCLSAARSSGSRRRQAGSILKKRELGERAIGHRGHDSGSSLLLALAAPAAGASAAESRRSCCCLPPAGPTRRRSWPRPGFSPGLMSAGLGTVPAEQTYLDIGQGNRVFDSLYDDELPPSARVPLRPADGRSRRGRIGAGGIRLPAEIDAGAAGRGRWRGRGRTGFGGAAIASAVGSAAAPRSRGGLRRATTC